MLNIRLRIVVLQIILVLSMSRMSGGQIDKHPYVVHAFVDGQSHAVFYIIGNTSRRYRNNNEFFNLLDKLHTNSPHKPFLFQISNDVPIGGIGGIFLVVDKYELGPARYFLVSKSTGAMSEIKRNDGGGFSTATPSVPISDNPN